MKVTGGKRPLSLWHRGRGCLNEHVGSMSAPLLSFKDKPPWGRGGEVMRQEGAGRLQRRQQMICLPGLFICVPRSEHTQTDNDAPMTRNTTPWSGAGRPLTSREIRGHQHHQYRQVTGLSPGCHKEPINNAN